jgi:hypothetical protein
LGEGDRLAIIEAAELAVDGLILRRYIGVYPSNRAGRRPQRRAHHEQRCGGSTSPQGRHPPARVAQPAAGAESGVQVEQLLWLWYAEHEHRNDAKFLFSSFLFGNVVLAR